MIYNAAPGFHHKDEIEKWAKARFPEEWDELMAIGQYRHIEGHKMFNIERPMRA